MPISPGLAALADGIDEQLVLADAAANNPANLDGLSFINSNSLQLSYFELTIELTYYLPTIFSRVIQLSTILVFFADQQRPSDKPDITVDDVSRAIQGVQAEQSQMLANSNQNNGDYHSVMTSSGLAIHSTYDLSKSSCSLLSMY